MDAGRTIVSNAGAETAWTSFMQTFLNFSLLLRPDMGNL